MIINKLSVKHLQMMHLNAQNTEKNDTIWSFLNYRTIKHWRYY